MSAVEQAAFPLTDAAVPMIGALNALRVPAADALTPLEGFGLSGAREPTGADLHPLTRPVLRPSADAAGAGRETAWAGDDVLTPSPGGGAPVPLPPLTLASSGPVQAVRTGAGSSDPSPADLPAAVRASITVALAVTDEARDAAGDIASDPSFSPD